MNSTSIRVERIRLPQELIDHIIDELTDDTNTLRACSLTSQSLRRPSQRNLFYCTKLYPITAPDDSKHSSLAEEDSGAKTIFKLTLCERLHHLLQSSPHIEALIRDLRLRDTERVSDSWLAKENSLPLILPRLKNLQRIYVAGSMSETLLNIAHLPSEVKKSLFKAIRSPKITHIGFQCVQFPTFPDLLEAIAGSAALKNLTLFAVDVVGDQLGSSSGDEDGKLERENKLATKKLITNGATPKKRSSLSSLGLFMGPSLSSQLSEWLLGPGSAYSLENLDRFSLVAEMTHELSLAKHVISASKGSLREMNITIVEGDENYTDTLDLSAPQVAYLGLDISSSNPLICQPILNWWCNSLETSESHNLETFNIFILTELDDITDFEYTAPGWKRLDEILSGKDQGADEGKVIHMNLRLKLLDVEDDEQKEDPLAPPGVLTRLEEAFPLMRAKGRLEVSQMTESLFCFLGVYWQ